MISKLKLTGFLLLLLLTIKGQNSEQFIAADKIEWNTYFCGGNTDVAKISGIDTLIVNPNPFDSVFVIQFTISHNDTIWLNVFSSTGHTVKTYYNGVVLSSGIYSYTFNGDTLPNGIYFVSLKINAVTQTVKLIKFSKSVGLKKNDTSNDLLVYPNPATSILNLPVEQCGFQNSSVEITNTMGKVVLNTKFDNQINIADLAAGIYFLTIQNDTGRKTTKIIKE